jgi:hypothetical protein
LTGASPLRASPTQFASVLSDISRLRATSRNPRRPTITCSTAAARNSSVYFRLGTYFIAFSTRMIINLMASVFRGPVHSMSS